MITRFEARTLFYAQVSYSFVESSEDTGDIREAKEVGISSRKDLKDERVKTGEANLSLHQYCLLVRIRAHQCVVPNEP